MRDSALRQTGSSSTWPLKAVSCTQARGVPRPPATVANPRPWWAAGAITCDSALLRGPDAPEDPAVGAAPRGFDTPLRSLTVDIAGVSVGMNVTVSWGARPVAGPPSKLAPEDLPDPIVGRPPGNEFPLDSAQAPIPTPPDHGAIAGRVSAGGGPPSPLWTPGPVASPGCSGVSRARPKPGRLDARDPCGLPDCGPLIGASESGRSHGSTARQSPEHGGLPKPASARRPTWPAA